MNTRFAKDIEYVHYYNSKSPIEIENEALNSPKIKSGDMIYLGFYEWSGVRSKIKIACGLNPNHKQKLTTIDILKNGGGGCQECWMERMRRKNVISANIRIDEFCSQNEKVKSNGFINGYINAREKNLSMDCCVHGKYVASLDDMQCPKCPTQKGGYDKRKPGTFYIQKLVDNCGCIVGYKFGITNKKAEERMKQQSSVSSIRHFIFHTLTTKDGNIPLKLEGIVRQKLSNKTHHVSQKVMPDGWTETIPPSEIRNLMYIVKSFEKGLTPNTDDV